MKKKINLTAKPFNPDIDEVSIYVRMSAVLFPNLKSPMMMIAKGNGMSGAHIHDGDYLIFDTDAAAKDGNIVIAEIDGQMMCRRIFIRDGRILVHREDDITPDFYAKTCHVKGVVRYMIGNLENTESAQMTENAEAV